MPKKELALKYATCLSVYLLIVWGLYRFLFKLPDEIEEIFVKPVFWLVPVFYLLSKEKSKISSLGITLKNLFPAVYFSLGLGAFFVIEAIFINFVKYKGFNFSANLGNTPFLTAIGLSFLTAIVEEITFRGYIFNRIWYALGGEWTANLVSSLAWGLVHVPITFFVWKLDIGSASVYLLLTILFGIGSAFVFARTRNVFSSILLHIFWVWPIILFR